MNESYLDYWNLKRPPFTLTPDPGMLYMGAQHSECLMRLKYAIHSHKGGSLLVSDNAGNGKTSILRRLIQDLNTDYEGRIRTVFIDHPTLTPTQMVSEIGRQLGGEEQFRDKIRALNVLRDKLYMLYNDDVRAVVIVDEGQMLQERPDLLGELRILLNFCVADAFLLSFIFSGQKPLDRVLRDMPEFWQRLPVRFFLKNLNAQETKNLVRFRIEQVGGDPDIYKDDAHEGIYRFSDGCPRIICSVADLCLVVGFANQRRRIGFVEVSQACRDMDNTGDSYHYFHFLETRSKKLKQVAAVQEVSKSPPVNPEEMIVGDAGLKYFNPEKVQSIEKTETDDVEESFPVPDEIYCPVCGGKNSPDVSFCTQCNNSLFVRCPKCGERQPAGNETCQSCSCNIREEETELTTNFLADVDTFDRMILLVGNKRL